MLYGKEKLYGVLLGGIDGSGRAGGGDGDGGNGDGGGLFPPGLWKHQGSAFGFGHTSSQQHPAFWHDIGWSAYPQSSRLLSDGELIETFRHDDQGGAGGGSVRPTTSTVL